MLLASAVAALAIAAAAGPEAAPQPQAGEKPARPKRVCQTVETSGSRMPKKVCRVVKDDPPAAQPDAAAAVASPQ